MKACNGTCQQGRKECICNYDSADDIYVAFIKKIIAVVIIFICLFVYLMVTA